MALNSVKKLNKKHVKLGTHTIVRTKQFAAKNKAWRVIAPYVTVPKKTKEKEDSQQISFYLKKRPEVLIRDLSSFLSDSVDLPSLFNETAEVLKTVTKASWVTVYLVDGSTNQLYQSNLRHLKDRHRVKWDIKKAETVATYVACKKEYVLIEDVLLDCRFPRGIGYNGSAHPGSVLCIPIVTLDVDCYGVVELVRTIDNDPFTENDLKICVMVNAWMGVAIHQNQERLALKRQQELNDYLLDVVKYYFGDHVLMDKLICEVVKFAKVSLGAERGSFFIIDEDSDEMIAYLFDEFSDTINTETRKIRFPKDRGIAGLVAKTGKTLNIKDTYADSRFNKEIDQKTGFITRSILCMPILGPNGVLGAVQVVNKKNGGCFSKADEKLFNTFSLYCSLAVHYTNIQSNVSKQIHLNKIYLRILKLMQQPCIHDLNDFLMQPTVSIPTNFATWYPDNPDEISVAPKYVLHIMCELIDSREMDKDLMIKFILSVRKLYRNLPYHNFEHAFNTCHCMYVILTKNQSKFTKLEIKALLVATLCHDLDHGGYTNNFLQIIQDDLAMLYESSFLEHHHVDTTLMLLNDFNIFPKLTNYTKKLFYDEIRNAILATDLTFYFQARHKLLDVCKTHTFTWSNPAHRVLLKSVMMTSCDVSGMCKPFLIAKKVSGYVYKEFYRQGDKEKAMGLCPISVMDRDQEDMVLRDQTSFLNVIVLPCIDTLCILLPNVKDLYWGGLQLYNTWIETLQHANIKIWRQDDSIVKS